jgi:hypothetical protein
VLSACQAFVWQHFSNPDGLSYLNMARAVAEGDWAQVHNPYWGPVGGADAPALAWATARVTPLRCRVPPNSTAMLGSASWITGRSTRARCLPRRPR